MINRISRGMTTFVSRYMPEPLVLAVLLSIVIFFVHGDLPSTLLFN
ncbi:Short-chain fatty acids transporter [Rodentibacter pneumotropicus]|uniref:Short-chain fatty acids transporter n=1 Tax=Rodentibacter pneumotropicus TaxID=758 RepID=A0A3S4TXE1_9PAST|nr:Short-chain fatty acids transporter [Rodentibacter pneumotropicus]